MVTLAADGEPTDQAAQAARCALAMQRALAGREIVLGTGRRILGGPAPFGEVIDRAALLLRRSVAARADALGAALTRTMGAVAPPRCRLDDVTAGLLDNRFEIGGDALSLFVAGEREELEDQARTLLGKLTPCVGRDRELAILDATFDECVRESVPRAVVVTAPVGVGKSRLRHEFVRRLAQRHGGDRSSAVTPPSSVPIANPSTGREGVDVWLARGDPMGMGSPFRMVGQLVRRTAGLLDGESPLGATAEDPRARRAAPTRARPRRRVKRNSSAKLCGVPFPDDESVQLRAARQDPTRMGDQMRRAFEDFLGFETAHRPVLVIFEDMHWGDLGRARSGIDHARQYARGFCPLMVLALARPEVNLFPQLWQNRGGQTIVLGELGKKASEKLVRNALGDRVRAEVVTEIIERAGGNAFYLEEMVRAVAEGRGDRLPLTVLAMVQARLDRLEPDARRVLRAASVFGQVRSGRGGVVGPVLGDDEAVRPAEWLDELTKREVIALRPAEKFPHDQEYAFRNAPMRDAAYESFTPEDRVLGHKLAAAWLEGAGEADIGPPRRAPRVGRRALARRSRSTRKAAAHALEGNDFAGRRSRGCGARRVACGAEGETRAELALIQADVHKLTGNNVEAEARYAEALALLPRGAPAWFKAIGDLATVRAKMGQHEPVLALGRELAQMHPSGAPFVGATARVAIQLLHTGHLDAADQLLRKAEARGVGRARSSPRSRRASTKHAPSARCSGATSAGSSRS